MIDMHKLNQIPDWPDNKIEDGVYVTRLSSWKEFGEIAFDKDKLIDRPYYIFRGHRRNDWLLESTLARIMKKSASNINRKQHLDNFKYAARGRRGFNPPNISEEEWWALGQHFGLATPLLDWTSSPYVALFFAFEKSYPNDETDTRVVLALNTKTIKAKCRQFENHPSFEPIKVLHSLSDENPRLVNQAGVFTISSDKIDIENWIKKYYKDFQRIVLAKVHIPNLDRNECLKALNKMNINHSTLFPCFASDGIGIFLRIY